ncbi:MAG: fasciclin domain-containing protein [Pseudomonadota bacterium]
MFRRTFCLAAAGLMLSACDVPLSSTEGAAGPGLTGDIVDTAAAAGSFNTLIAAVQAAGLEETLRGPGPLTVFAPTDAAFADLPPGSLDRLLQPENRDQLVSILTFHVVPGDIRSDALVGRVETVSAANGESLTVDGTNGVVVKDANVITADVEATNGVIHVIDKVLLP